MVGILITFATKEIRGYLRISNISKKKGGIRFGYPPLCYAIVATFTARLFLLVHSIYPHELE